jgi:hypothetical protein
MKTELNEWQSKAVEEVLSLQAEILVHKPTKERCKKIEKLLTLLGYDIDAKENEGLYKV